MPTFRSFGAGELLIILLIVILLFGPGRLGRVAGEFGKSIRAFREGLKGPEDQAPKPVEPKNDSPDSK